MLDELSKQDTTWREIAYKICGDKSLADDLVNDMYLRMYEQQPDKITNGYVYTVIRNLFIDHTRERSKLVNTDFSNVEILSEEEQQQQHPTFEQIAGGLTWYEKTIFVQATLVGQRELARKTDIHIQTIHRVTNAVKNKLWLEGKKIQDLETL